MVGVAYFMEVFIASGVVLGKGVPLATEVCVAELYVALWVIITRGVREPIEKGVADFPMPSLPCVPAGKGSSNVAEALVTGA